MRALIARYPDFYAASPQFVDIQQALEPELLALWDARDSVLEQLCADTATWGLQYWERALGLAVETGKDMDFRRSRIRSKLRGAGVTTVAMIRNVAESFSNGQVSVIERPAQYRLDIKFVGTVGVPPNMDDLTEALRDIMPAHLAWDYIIMYNRHQTLAGLTHARLAAYTHDQLRNEVISDGD